MQESKRQFIGIKNLYGNDGLEKLKNSHVLVIGIGGVGSWAAESLVRSGIGEITLMDMDDICVSNTNRQIHANSKTIGQEKVEVMKKRLLAINPEAKVHAEFDFFSKSNAESVLSKKYDFILDAMDSIDSKCYLSAECRKRNLPFLTTGAAGSRKDPTLISVKDLNRTVNDKLTKRMKRILKKDYGFKKYHDYPYKIPCVTSSEVIEIAPPRDETTDVATHIQNCQTNLGSVSHVTAVMGFTAAGFIVNGLTGALDD